LKARPRSPDYYLVRKECPFSEARIVATSKALVAGLWTKANALERQGDPGKAALLYNDLMARADGVDPHVKAVAEEKVYQLFTTALAGSPKGGAALLTVDPDQGKAVLNAKGKAKVSEFQEAKGLKRNGKIDYPTLAVAAGADIGGYLAKGPPS
jgi:hypothetical protein